MEMIQNKLHSKTHTNKLLNRGSPLQDPLGGNSINKVMLDVIHHALQHPQEVLSGRTTKAESLHKVTTAAIDLCQVRNAILKDSEAMEVYKRGPEPQNCTGPRSLTSGWSKRVNNATASLIGSEMVTKLLPTSN